MQRYPNIYGLPYLGYKHPRERPSEQDKQATNNFVRKLAVKHAPVGHPLREGR